MNHCKSLLVEASFSLGTALAPANQLEHLREILSSFNAFYDGFDPSYTFWAGNAHEAPDAAMQAYADALRRYVVGAKPGETPPTIGDPVLAEGLRADPAVEIWRLAMSSLERQLRNPFFSGGEVTSLSYPEISQSYQQKVMSMRGNTPHFNFPTVHHELVPGHHLQPFMFRRFNSGVFISPPASFSP